MKIIFFMGPPGSGKGTNAEMLQDDFDITTVSLGRMIRQEIRSESELGKKIKSIVQKGNLIPHEDAMVFAGKAVKFCQSQNKKACIFDGFPREMSQAKDFEKDHTPDLVVYLTVNEKKVVKRLSSRRVCPKCGEVYGEADPPKKAGICDKCETELIQRKDDTEEVIRDRFKVYYESTEPVINHYKDLGILKEVSSDQSIPDVYNDVKKVLFKKFGATLNK